MYEHMIARVWSVERLHSGYSTHTGNPLATPIPHAYRAQQSSCSIDSINTNVAIAIPSCHKTKPHVASYYIIS